ncbi:lipid transfer-like protein VAS [Quercus lobata]|uniref:Bifunctional inhibitor/plant lipid transfer protein/seed storage helical domain-containing protein n=1 Tax=Quercus lobata TaxID=97700 RepID=A0A7N2KXZ0_QUELO|nr:lipid transfer-like protein VAS [Quercus lobata]
MEMKLLWLYFGIAFLALAILMPNGWAQDTSCLNQLAPCLNYLNGTRNPPDSCCNPLKSVIKSNPKCLCNLISIKSSRKAEQAGINVNQAQMLPGRCGQNVNPISCLSVSSSPSGPSPRGSSSNSASISSFQSKCIILITALSIALQILWAPCM